MQKQCVVISGASTGIGNALALEFDKRGYYVFAGVRQEKDAAELKKQASERLTPVMLDVTNQESVDAVARQVQASGLAAESLTILCNAGVVRPGPIEQVPVSDSEATFAVNYFGALRLIKGLLQLAYNAQSARIALIGSIGGRIAQPLVADYTASKAALRSFSRSLRMELEPFDIPVVLIEPGAVQSELNARGGAFALGIQATATPESKKRWDPLIAALPEISKRFQGKLTAKEAALRIVSVITRPRPRAEVLIGTDAKAFNLLQKLLPRGVFASIISRGFQIHRVKK